MNDHAKGLWRVQRLDPEIAPRTFIDKLPTPLNTIDFDECPSEPSYYADVVDICLTPMYQVPKKDRRSMYDTCVCLANITLYMTPCAVRTMEYSLHDDQSRIPN